MTLKGTVVNGQLVFPDAPPLPEGFVVRVTFTDQDDGLIADTPIIHAERTEGT